MCPLGWWELRVEPIYAAAASSAATYLAVAVTSLAVGYWIGVGSTLPITRGSAGPGAPEDSDDAPGSDDGEDSESEAGGEGLDQVKAGAFEECKMVSHWWLASTAA